MAKLGEETPAGINHLKCDCETTAIRSRTRNNGAEAHVIQCLTCGREMRQVKKSADELPSFDERLLERWQWRQREFWRLQTEQRERQKEEENAEWWDRYSAYLKTKQWEEKRKLVLERDKYVCQGCRRNKAHQVHHLTYDNVFNELLFVLISVCIACHRLIHPILGSL